MMTPEEKAFLNIQKEFLFAKRKSSNSIPFTNPVYAHELDTKKTGENSLIKGELGVVILAGGQGTRLKFPHPKGKFPITPVKKKTLFQYVAEKTLAASKLYKTPLKIAFMTSTDNDEETKSYFIENGYFGLEKAQISFFIQEDLLLLNQKGDPFLSEPETLARGPAGNGQVFKYLAQSGVLSFWKDTGIKYIHTALIDNPLADPFDPTLLGYLIDNNLTAVAKGVEKKDPDEKMGVFASQDGHLKVIEYSELEPEENKKFQIANTSLFALSLEFVEKLAKENFPLHIALKAFQTISASGQIIPPGKPQFYKFEMFIFDLLDFTDKSQVIVFPRDACFAPLKNETGPDSPQTVQQALEKYDRQLITHLSGYPVMNTPIELSPSFHYPTDELLSYWKGKKIEPDLQYFPDVLY